MGVWRLRRARGRQLMAQNLLDDLLAEMRDKLDEYERAYLEALAQLDQIENDRQIQVGIVRGVEMAIERLTGQPAQG